MLFKKHCCNFFCFGNHVVLAPGIGYTRGLQGGLLSHNLSHLGRKILMPFFICHRMLFKNIVTIFFFEGNHGELAPTTGLTRRLQRGSLNHNLSHLLRKISMSVFICRHMLFKKHKDVFSEIALRGCSSIT